MAKSTSSVARFSSTAILLGAILACPIVGSCGSAELANDQSIGRSCDLTFASSLQKSAYNTGASECPSHLCLKPTQDSMVTLLDPAVGPTCSGDCTQDSDCAGELRDPGDPSDTRCKAGFTCAVPFEVGPLACRKLCVCKDIVGTGEAQTPVGCQGVDSPPLTSDLARIGETTDDYWTLAPARKVDIVAMVDNSPTMGPKIEKFRKAFPKLLDATRDNEGFLADLRVAILDSDLGTGGAQMTGACAPKILADGSSSLFGDLGRFQMLSSPTACTFTRGSLFLEHKSGSALNYSGDLGSVASCLIGNLGTGGCGLSHPLQAFELALSAPGFGNEVQQSTFLRPEAYLALLFVTDKDDCSAAPNDGMFSDLPELRGESPSLRCATRAHTCGGMNLSTSGPGYPTVASYTHAFSDCQARTDACPSSLDLSATTDTSVPTTCSPLRGVTDMAKAIVALKDDPYKVVVAGFFGWPMSNADTAPAQYKIAPVPNPDVSDTAHPTVFDAWPVCYDPDHLPSPATTDPATGFDATAAAWGATGGLRASAFIDALGSDALGPRMKFSVCQPDFSDAMAVIGSYFEPKLQYLCVDEKPVDVDLVTPGLQPDCRVVYRTLVVSADDSITYVESPQPRCPPDANNGEVERDCWQLSTDQNRCPINGQRIKILRTAAELAAGPLPGGTKIGIKCHTCPAVAPGTPVPPGCDD